MNVPLARLRQPELLPGCFQEQAFRAPDGAVFNLDKPLLTWPALKKLPSVTGGYFASGTFGNLGRNTIYGPNWRTVDVALLKNFSVGILGESGGLQLKLSATDVFNHPNLGLPDSTYTDGGFGQINYANTSRRLQLGAKFTF